MDEDETPTVPSWPPNLHLVQCCGSCVHITGYIESRECGKHKIHVNESWICDDYEENDAEWLQPSYRW